MTVQGVGQILRIFIFAKALLLVRRLKFKRILWRRWLVWSDCIKVYSVFLGRVNLKLDLWIDSLLWNNLKVSQRGQDLHNVEFLFDFVLASGVKSPKLVSLEATTFFERLEYVHEVKVDLLAPWKLYKSVLIQLFCELAPVVNLRLNLFSLLNDFLLCDFREKVVILCLSQEHLLDCFEVEVVLWNAAGKVSSSEHQDILDTSKVSE